MNRHFWASLLCLILVTVARVGVAQTAPNERNQYGAGDLVITAVDMPVFETLDGATKLYAPGYSQFWIDGSKADATKPTWVVHFRCIPKTQGRALIRCDDKRGPANPEKLQENELVRMYSSYVVTEEDLNQYAPRTLGVEYGALIAPYKFHLTDNSLTGEATVGGYLGYRLASPGVAITPVIATGIGVVSVSEEKDDGTTEDSNKASLTGALGFITTFTRQGSFQVGLLVGWDWTGDGSGYKYEGKPWIALSFGTKLTQ